MSAVMDSVEDANAELVDDSSIFFAPVATDLLDSLIGQHQAARGNIDKLAGIATGAELGNVMHYFIEGNCGDERLHRSIYVDKLFAIDGAVGALNSAYWSKALALTDVYNCMPQERKNEWNKQLQNPGGVKRQHSRWNQAEGSEWESEPLPEFEESTVRSTIGHLLNARSQFLGERVDGIFRALSGLHVTNAPEAFGKRMIVARVLSSYGSIEHSTAGFLHDLRCVIAKFMGREEPANFGSTSDLITIAKSRRGEWVYADGGALKLRVYKVGTAHLEVHPDMAWRLNQILAFLHPLAIPAEFRAKPKRKSKTFDLMRNPMPFAVSAMIARMRPGVEKVGDEWQGRTKEIPNTRRFDYGDHDKATLAQAERVIESIGGVKTGMHYSFDYEPREVLQEIVASGCIPDGVSHQFYPTPESIAKVCVELAEIDPELHTVLEPSAGQGDLAAMLPSKKLATCVEVSALHCAILKARGFHAVQADFLAWSSDMHQAGVVYDRVVMNPPFSEGRAAAHVQAAALLVAPAGVLVAIMPASARNKFVLDGFDCSWSPVYSNEFAGTSVSVAILTAAIQA